MALVYPLDLLAGFKGGTTEFDLLYRQELSRQANGVTRAKDLGSPIWSASYQSINFETEEFDYWRARLKALEGGLKTFMAWPLFRPWPIAYPRGSWPTGSSWDGTGTVGAVGATRNSISLSGFPEGYQVSVGDYLRIGERDLHQVMEARTVTAAGNTSLFEVRPHIWPGVSAGAAVSVVRPHCIMMLVPGSLTTSADPQTGWGMVSFQGVEAR